MAKRQIPVTGIKETELIQTLNENLGLNKIAASQEFLENNTDTESDNWLDDYAQEVYDSCSTVITKEELVTDAPQEALDRLNTEVADTYNCGTEIVEDNAPLYKIITDCPREIKNNTQTDKIGYANAGPSPVWDNTIVFKGLSPEARERFKNEAMKRLKNIILPEAESILKRFDQTLNELKDDKDICKAINSEISNSANLTDYGKKVFETGKIATGKDAEYEMVNHPTHYNQYDIEVIDMIIKIWGPEAAALWCDITAFKYRMRMGTKPDNSIEQDIKKEQWYLNKSKEIRENLINKN